MFVCLSHYIATHSRKRLGKKKPCKNNQITNWTVSFLFPILHMFYQTSFLSLNSRVSSLPLFQSLSHHIILLLFYLHAFYIPVYPSSTHNPCLHFYQTSFLTLSFSHRLYSPSPLLRIQLLFLLLNPIFINLRLSNCFFHFFYFSPRPVLWLFGLCTLLVGGQGHVYHLVYKLRLAKRTSEKVLCPHCLITLAFLHIKCLQPFMRMCALSITSFTLTPTEKSNTKNKN